MPPELPPPGTCCRLFWSRSGAGPAAGARPIPVSRLHRKAGREPRFPRCKEGPLRATIKSVCRALHIRCLCRTQPEACAACRHGSHGRHIPMKAGHLFRNPAAVQSALTGAFGQLRPRKMRHMHMLQRQILWIPQKQSCFFKILYKDVIDKCAHGLYANNNTKECERFPFALLFCFSRTF